MTKIPNTNVHNIFKTSSALEEEGAWVTVNEMQGLKLKLRRLRADSVMKEFEKRVNDRYGDGKMREIANGTADKSNPDATKDESNEILKIQLFCTMVDWSGLVDTDTGEEIPFNEELAMHLLDMRDFREFVYQATSERQAFRDKDDAESEGN